MECYYRVFLAQTSLKSPNCDRDSQSAEGSKELISLPLRESTIPQHFTHQVPIQVGDVFMTRRIINKSTCSLSLSLVFSTFHFFFWDYSRISPTEESGTLLIQIVPCIACVVKLCRKWYFGIF